MGKSAQVVENLFRGLDGCPPGKVVNPITLNCVKEDGAIGKQVLKQKAEQAVKAAAEAARSARAAQLKQDVRQEVEQQLQNRMPKEVRKQVSKKVKQTEEVRKHVQHHVEREMKQEMKQAVQEKVRDEGSKVRQEVQRQMQDQVEQVKQAMQEKVRDEGSQVRQEVQDQVEQVKQAVEEKVRDEGTQVESQVRREVQKQVQQEVPKEVQKRVEQGVQQASVRNVAKQGKEKTKEEIKATKNTKKSKKKAAKEETSQGDVEGTRPDSKKQNSGPPPQDVSEMRMTDILYPETGLAKKDSHRFLKSFLQMYFGYNQICLLYYLAVKSDLKCESSEECLQTIQKMEGRSLVQIFTENIDILAKRLFAIKSSLVKVLCEHFLLHSASMRDYVSPGYFDSDHEFVQNVDVSDIEKIFPDLSADDVGAVYFKEGLTSFLAQDSAKRSSCDIQATDSNYNADMKDTVMHKEVKCSTKGERTKHCKDGTPEIKNVGVNTVFSEQDLSKSSNIESIRHVYKSKQPSILNVWNDPKDFCPPNYVLQTDTRKTRRLWHTRPGKCCVPKESFVEYDKGSGAATLEKLKRAVRTVQTEKTLFEALVEEGDEIWEDAVDILQGTSETRDRRMREMAVEIQRRIESEKNKANREELAAVQRNLMNLKAVEEEWEKLERDQKLYRIVHAKEGFVDRMYNEIIYFLKKAIYQFFLTSNNSDTTGIVYILQKARDVLMIAIVKLIEHPRFTLMITQILKYWKKQVCDAIAIENGMFQIKTSLGEVKETLETGLEASYLITIATLMDPARSHRVADMIVDSFESLIALFGASFAGSFGATAPKIFGTIVKPVLGDAIQSVTTALVHYEGYKRLMEVLDIASCGKTVAMVSNFIKMNSRHPDVQDALMLPETIDDLTITLTPVNGTPYELSVDGVSSYVRAAFAAILEIFGRDKPLLQSLEERGAFSRVANEDIVDEAKLALRPSISAVTDPRAPSTSNVILAEVVMGTLRALAAQEGGVIQYLENLKVIMHNERRGNSTPLDPRAYSAPEPLEQSPYYVAPNSTAPDAPAPDAQKAPAIVKMEFKRKYFEELQKNASASSKPSV